MAKIRLFIQGIEHGGSERVVRAAEPNSPKLLRPLFSP